MSRKHYKAIAALFKMNVQFFGPAEFMRQRLARDMGVYLASQNPKFEFDKFMDACGVGV